jgi:hypothetical protein
MPIFGRNKTSSDSDSKLKSLLHSGIRLIKDEMRDNSYFVIILVLVVVIILLCVKNIRDIKVTQNTKK